jgi:hypothetical protein
MTVAAPPHLERLRHLSWSGFSFTLPSGWEPTAFALDPANGRIQFHERTRPCGEVSWRQAKGTADHVRNHDEVLRRWLATEFPTEDVGSLRPSHRRVDEFTLSWVRPGSPLLASMQLSDGRLLQWLWPDWSEELIERVARPLLATFRPNRGDTRRWELFGLRLSLPAAFTYEDLEPRPADVELVLETPRHQRVIARRLGMDRALLSGVSLNTLQRRLLARAKCRVLRVEEASAFGRPALRTEFERRGEKQLDQVLGRWWRGEAWIWHDPDEGRVYGFEQFGPAGEPSVALADAWLWDGPGGQAPPGRTPGGPTDSSEEPRSSGEARP